MVRLGVERLPIPAPARRAPAARRARGVPRLGAAAAGAARTRRGPRPPAGGRGLRHLRGGRRGRRPQRLRARARRGRAAPPPVALAAGGAAAGSDYELVRAGVALPAPWSRGQREGRGGPSRLLAPRAFAWTDAGFRAPPLRDAVIYELHVGTFTPEGTFEAAIPHLDE